MHKQPFAGKLAVLSIGMLGLAASFTAQAAPVTYGNCASEQGCYTLDIEYIEGAISGPKQDGINHPDTWVYDAGDGAQYFNYFGSTWGFDGGHIGVSANGSGDSFFSRASTIYRAELTNNSDEAKILTYKFSIDGGGMFFEGVGDGFFGFGELLLSIRVNGVELERDQTTMITNSGTGSCTSNDLGTKLGDFMKCPYGSSFHPVVSALSYDFSVDLGLFGAGETIQLEYSIIATAYSNGPYVGVSAGDPFNSSWTPIKGYFRDNDNGNDNNVPEPSSLALLGLAFAGLGVVRRRQRNRA